MNTVSCPGFQIGNGSAGAKLIASFPRRVTVGRINVAPMLHRNKKRVVMTSDSFAVLAHRVFGFAFECIACMP
eukprot:3349261-Amphidinium_carterae.1